MDVAVVGMGRIGRAIALRLLSAGHKVTVWNRTPGRASDVVAAGAKEAGSPEEAAEGARSVHLSLAGDQAVDEVVLGGSAPDSAGLAAALGDAALVDHSTVAPITSRRIADAVPGGRMIAAPVLGGPEAVEKGTAFYLLAGPPSEVEALDPLWRALSPSHRFCGEDQGVATTLKLLANYLLMSGLATLSETIATGQAAGIDNGTLREFFTTIPLIAPGLVNRLDALIAGDHDGWFSARLGAKDVRLTAELAGSVGVDLPIAALIQRRYEELDAHGLGDADISAIIELLR
jgi:3-hydroxyisobutyrate dehydrogenase-like beta-hydroxyacid dehydrogenase